MKNKTGIYAAWREFCEWSIRLRKQMKEDGFTEEEIDKIFWGIED